MCRGLSAGILCGGVLSPPGGALIFGGGPHGGAGPPLSGPQNSHGDLKADTGVLGGPGARRGGQSVDMGVPVLGFEVLTPAAGP